jgi:hypothetical protein
MPAWDAPWFAALRPGLDLVATDAGAGRWDAVLRSLNALALAGELRNEAGVPLRFVDAAGVQAASYEAHIWSSGEVPTRIDGDGCWHDLFNALAWLAFPRTKARLNALQANIVAREGVGRTRGGLRDAATLFDENAALFITTDRSLADALRNFDWRELFVRRRDAFRAGVQVLVFGHALVDKLRAPYKAICAHAWLVDPAPAAGSDGLCPAQVPAQARLDEILSAGLHEASLRTAAFAPLPVLGIPGWWPANRDPAFYDDTSVFRAGRHRSTRLQGD